MNIREGLSGAPAATLLAIGCSKNSEVAKRTVGWVHYWKDMVGQAMVCLHQSLDMESNNPVCHYDVGMALARMGDDAKARRVLERALQLDPQFPGAAQARKTLTSLVY